jgi:hypothetical protein
VSAPLSLLPDPPDRARLNCGCEVRIDRAAHPRDKDGWFKPTLCPVHGRREIVWVGYGERA